MWKGLILWIKASSVLDIFNRLNASMLFPWTWYLVINKSFAMSHQKCHQRAEMWISVCKFSSRQKMVFKMRIWTLQLLLLGKCCSVSLSFLSYSEVAPVSPIKTKKKKDERIQIVRDTLGSNERHYSHSCWRVYAESLPLAEWPVCDTIWGISWPPSCCSGPVWPVRRPVDIPLIKRWGLLFQRASSFPVRDSLALGAELRPPNPPQATCIQRRLWGWMEEPDFPFC